MLLGAYGTADQAADIDGSGEVNLIDLSILLSNYGKTGPTVPTATPTIGPTITPSPTPTIPLPQRSGIWISQQELQSLLESGSAWEKVSSTAQGSLGSANVSDQDSEHDVKTLAVALYCAKTGKLCDKAKAAVVSAIDTEDGGRWLAVGRNLTSYVVAADLLNLSSESNGNKTVRQWIEEFLTCTPDSSKVQNMNLCPEGNNNGIPRKSVPFASGSNASAQEAAAYAAVAAHLGAAAPSTQHPYTGEIISGTQHLDRVWNAFRRYACDPGSPNDDHLNLHDSTWRYSDPAWPENNGLSDGGPCGVNPKGSIAKQGGNTYSIDGAIPNDMRRGSKNFAWPPDHTNYPGVGLEGFVPAALILHRAGYPAFQIADRAVLRTHEFLWYLDQNTGNDDWFLEKGYRASEIMHLVKVAYGATCTVCSEWPPLPSRYGKTVGFTDWTHPTINQINN
jgi:hypothetical protein